MSDSKRVLEPMERISEVLFGLIIVLTFTCSVGVASANRSEVHTMLLQAIGCCLAWAIIDAVFYLLGCLADHGHNLRLLQRVQQSADPEEARQLITDALPAWMADRLPAEAYEKLHQEARQFSEPSARPRLTSDDWRGSLGVFLLAFLSIVPVIIPYTFMRDARMALRVSNGTAVFLLFIAGYALGRYASPHPWRVGLAMVAFGAAMVGICIALGG